MLEMNEMTYDHNLKHWPFANGIIPTVNPRRKQLLYELKCLREENEYLHSHYEAQQEVIDDKTAKIRSLESEVDALKRKLNTIMLACIEVRGKTHEDSAKRDCQIAELSRDKRVWQETAHRLMADKMGGNK